MNRRFAPGSGPVPLRADPRTYAIIGAAMEVHRQLGPGFLEAVYQEALAREMLLRGIPFRREVSLPVRYKGELLAIGYRADFICFDEVIVETKALTALTSTEESQVLNYLKATALEVALLLNFGESSLVHRRFANTVNKVVQSSASVQSAKSADLSPVRTDHGSSFDVAPVAPEAVAEALRGLGYDFFTGVPCSLVSGLIRVLDEDPAIPYYPETREDAAVGLAAGAMMAGKRPVVLMQNSGLGVCVNALTSMALMYQTPMLLLITWRGCGPDAPEHLIMGDISARLLELIGVEHREPEPESLLEDLAWATERQAETMLPVALLLRPGVTR